MVGLFIHTVCKKIKDVKKYIYIQKARHFAKRKTISVMIVYTKTSYFTLRNFHENAEVGIYIQKA